MQYIGELSIHLSIIWQARQSNLLDSEAARNAIYFCHKIIKDLQSQSLSLRMQPLQSFFQRMERTAKDVARTQNKPVDIKFFGETVELDKSVIERMTDAFVHILRNAVDHGLESADDRLRIGKPGRGCLTISAVNQANMVTISVADDGKGLDSEKIMAKAVEKGLVKAGQNLTPEEIYRLILLPGFSTADKLTEISGRGVGMDVVSKSIYELSGTLEIKSKKGYGTEFRINLPTSVSIFDALIISIEGLKYAVPIQDISEVIDLSTFQINTSTQSSRMISLRGLVVPVQDLKEYLRTVRRAIGNRDEVLPRVVPKSGQKSPALIVKTNSGHFVAFSADMIHGLQSTVVRKLTGKFEKMPGIIGSTILGDGEPGMILSLPQLAQFYSEKIGRKDGTHG